MTETITPLAEPSVTTSRKGSDKPRMTTPLCKAPLDTDEAFTMGALPITIASAMPEKSASAACCEKTDSMAAIE